MQKYTDTILSRSARPISGAVVSVTDYPQGTSSAIYATVGGTAVNSVTTDSNGRFSFYAEDGHYNITVSGAGIVPYTLTDISLNDPSNDAAAVAPSGPRLQVVATRGRMPVNVEGGGSTNYTRFESLLRVRTGPRPVNSIQLVYCNRYAVSGGETFVSNNDYQVESAINYGGPTVPVTFHGARSPVFSQGATLVISDKIGLSLAANTALQLRSGAIVASGQKVPVAQPAASLYNGYVSTVGASQVYTNGGFAMPAGGDFANLGFIPLAVIGIPDTRHVAVMLWGDSITYGTGDTVGESTFGHVGWGERGLIGAGAGGANIPFVNVSRPGDSTGTWSAAAFGYQGTRWALLEYVTHVVFGMGINDPVAGRTLSQMQANVQTAWANAKRLGLKVYQTTLTPNTTSTDSFATVANQSVVAGYDTAGIRGQFNAWLASQVTAKNIDGIIDINGAVCDSGFKDKWAINGTANFMTGDGLHPSVSGHALMGLVLNQIASTWTV